jgi:LacI family transcriptional regulator
VVSDLSNNFFQEIAFGLENQLTKEGYRLIIMNSKEQKDTEIENVKNLIAGAADALVIAPTIGDCSYLRFLLDNNPIPVTFVDRRPEGFESDVVLATNEQGAYDAVKALTDKGHTNIAFFGSRQDSTMIERLDGYKKALEEAGVSVNANLIRFGNHDSVSQRALRHGVMYHHAMDVLSNYDITAIFSGNNLATLGVFSYIKEANIQVPKDVSFITFDDSSWLTMTTPALSAVTQNPEKMGRVTAKLVLERLLEPQSAEKKTFQIVRISTQLILRGSV